MKWLWAILAFIFTSLFVSGITINYFISSVDSGFENAKLSINGKSSKFIDDSYSSFYSNMDQKQKENIEKITELPDDFRKQVLSEYCTPEKKEEPFCDARYISGEMSFEQIMKLKIKGEFEKIMTEALTEVNSSFLEFTKYPLIPLSIVAAILGLVFYMAANGMLKGIQVFLGNISWLSFFSAISFKIMPNTLKILVSRFLYNLPAQSKSISEIMKEILFDWLTPVMVSAYIFSLWIAAISFILWIIIKLCRNYTLKMN